ncbi:hypothetical protein J6590_104129 [Homalodisca vitripennis]|nr:hypothetical protein J6590_104129 [Homalodisca vitripennis]
MLNRIPLNFLQNHIFLVSQIEENESLFAHPHVRNLLSSDEKFDLIISELWNSDLFLAFAHKFKDPVIAMSSCLEKFVKRIAENAFGDSAPSFEAHTLNTSLLFVNTHHSLHSTLKLWRLAASTSRNLPISRR